MLLWAIFDCHLTHLLLSKSQGRNSTKVLNHLKSLNTKIAFLQETHLKPSGHPKLHRGWVGQLYHSSFSSNACGVAIPVHKSVFFFSLSDLHSCQIILSGDFNFILIRNFFVIQMLFILSTVKLTSLFSLMLIQCLWQQSGRHAKPI